jgi:hypothetical protein
MEDYIIVVNTDLTISMFNEKMGKLVKDKLNIDLKKGDNIYKAMYNIDSPPEWDPFIPSIKSKKVVVREFISPITKSRYSVISIPMIYNGISGVVGITTGDDYCAR